MRIRLLLAVFALFIASAPLAAEPPVLRSELLAHIKKLASDEWEGRATGSEGEKKATEYIRAHLEKLGLEPAGEDGGWFQNVEMPAGHSVGKNTSFDLKGKQGGKVTLKLGKEFTALSMSGSGIVEGEVVFAGYGISSPGSYDDYAGVDVDGKIVVVFRHTPRGDAGFNRSMRAHASFQAKLNQATNRGAIALVVVNDPHGFTRPQGRQRRPRPDALMTRSAGGGVGKIPCMHVTLAAAKKIFPKLFRLTPEKVEKRIGDGKGMPEPVSLPGRGRIRIQAEIERKTIQGRNVCARLRTKNRQPLEGVLVVGAHHDHLGRGKFGSLERDPKARNAIHNGADDNASGTSGLLEAAEYLASKRDSLKRDILFITFTGEERGLVGSRYWCSKPTVPLKKIIAMINMDMIGRLDGRKLFIGGTGTSPVWEPMLNELIQEVGIKTVFGAGGRAPSDNTSFYQKNLPVLFFFTGLHEQYHRPADDWDRIDVASMEKVATLAARTAERTANLPERPKFQKADQGGGGPPRPVLGISLGRGQGGVAVGGVAPNGPAAKAGIQEGDLILEVAGKKTAGPGQLRRVLRDCEIGQKVKVKVRRDGEEMEFDLVLGGA
ncbi:MAG: M28 family peptidase [Planctomycetota bacterium]|jgi:hypothetical protein